MDFGIFSKVYKQYPLKEAFYKIKEHGLKTVQFNFTNVGLSSLPTAIDQQTLEQIKEVIDKTGITISVISGTFNTLELDESKHEMNMKGFSEVVRAAAELRVPFVSISTGSFNQEDFWSPHPDNHTEKAWEYLYRSLDEMLPVAEAQNVVIIIEPEQANVVSTPADIIKLFEHYGNTKYLRVLFDAANIVTVDDTDHLKEKIKKALKQIGKYTVIAHCKDCIVSGERIEFAPVGKGNLPLNSYLKELKKYYGGPVIMHGLAETDVKYALDYLQNGRED